MLTKRFFFVTPLWLCLALPLIVPLPAAAAWPYHPKVNVPLCTAAGDQNYPTIVADGAGGAIVTWQDNRSGSWEIYAQRVLASGAADPTWPASGRALCTAAVGGQPFPTIVSDGAGGAIVTWQDDRSGSPDIYAQRVLASGTVDPAWPANGRALSTAAQSQYSPTIVADGAGGAIVTWQDDRSGSPRIYAQRVLASGAVDPAWPEDGRALCTVSRQGIPAIVSDGAGGAIVTWGDARSGGGYDIYAQRVLASGAVDPAWPADGRALSTAAGNRDFLTIVSDGAGGAIVAWADRGGSYDIYAQRVLASGAVDPAWPANGRALCTASGDQYPPMIVADEAGGAIVTWRDLSSLGIYAQRVLASGAVDPAWPANGRALSTAATSRDYPTIVADGAGGAIVTWPDVRNGSYDIYAQRVLASGAVDPAWPVDGRPVCAAASDQDYPTIVSDGAGGAIVTWQDRRSLSSSDIYAQWIGPAPIGPEPRIIGVADIPADQGGKVRIKWAASYWDILPSLDVSVYGIWRQVEESTALQALAEGARLAEGSAEARPREFRITMSGTGTLYWEGVGTVAARGYPTYTFTAFTFQDSTADSNPYSVFMVDAHAQWWPEYWSSEPDSGYSVDNLSPPIPVPFTATYGGHSNALHWTTSRAPDLREFRLHRGASLAFVPGPTNLVVATQDTGYVDGSGQFYYKLAALDIHGNASRYATVSPELPTATLASLASYEAQPDRIRLTWYLDGGAGASASIYRRTVDGEWTLLGQSTADGSGYLRYDDQAVAAGTRYGYQLGITDGDGEAFAGEAWVTAESPNFALALEAARPNPARSGDVTVHFVLPGTGAAKLELFDTAGRRVAEREVGSLGPGPHAVNLAAGARLSAGVYLVRFTQGVNQRTERVAVLD